MIVTALLIAITMMVAMSAVAFAAEDVKIQIGDDNNSYYTKGADSIDYEKHTFKAAQILAAKAYDAAKNEYTGLSWGTAVTDDGAALLSALQADDTWGSDFEDFTTNASAVDNDVALFTAAAFAKTIEGADADKARALALVLRDLYANEGQTISGTDEVVLTAGIGYYFIDDVTTGLDDDAANPVILFAAPGSNKIRIKADKPSQDKEVKENTKAEWNEVADRRKQLWCHPP